MQTTYCNEENPRADRIIEFIETFCRTPEGANVGQLIKLADFQKRFIRDAYRPGVRRAILSVARKNGKTTLIAGMTLAHICGPEARLNNQLISGAMNIEQAALIYNAIKTMVMMSEDLSAVCEIRASPRTVIGLKSNTRYRPITAVAKSAHGLSPAFAILDEIGQIRGEVDPFVDAITTSQGAHQNPLLVVISTQAASDNDLLSVMIDDALDTGNPDPATVCHLYTADSPCEIEDERQWRKANPGLGIINTVESVRTAARLATRMSASESAFRNLHLNQRVETFDPYIQRSHWEACQDSPGNASVWYAGLDLSETTDLTAYVRVGWTPEGRLACKARFFLPTEGLVDKVRKDRQPYDLWMREGFIEAMPGATMDYGVLAQIILDDIRADRIRMLAYDRWRMETLIMEMQYQGVKKSELNKLAAFGQGYKSMSPALDDLDSAILNHKLQHGNNPVMTMCAQNAVVQRDPAGNRKLTKAVSTRRIDGIIALAMAVSICTKEPKRASVYSDLAELKKYGFV